MITTQEKPILFSASMVQAILANRKTQTRRIIKPQPELCHGCQSCEFRGDHFLAPIKPIREKGDTLWVRETWGQDGENYLYAADYRDPPGLVNSWKSSIHMPRIASRITLKVTDVRTLRLQDISEEDAIREGIGASENHSGTLSYTISIKGASYNAPTAKEVFAMLWESIHGDKSWDVNPWCWVTGFERQ